jgi:metal-dependent HD superfamily phosphatase/phosphodiesterase
MYPISPLLAEELLAQIVPTRFPSDAEINAMTPEVLRDTYRFHEEWTKQTMQTAMKAFAAGAEYISLTNGDREVGRIYADGRMWCGE